MQIPAELTDVAAVNKDGWSAALADGVLTWSGGPQDAHTPTDFSITFTAPAEGTELRFPIVQTCETGEISWIDATEADEHPAPVVQVGPAGAPPSTAAADEEASADAEVTTTVGNNDTATTADAPNDNDGDDGGSSAVPIAIGVVVLLAIGGGAVLLRSRQSD